jgi:hypothetical protein
MFFLKKLMTIFVVSLILGCANSGVVQIGPNSFMLAKSEWGFTSGAVHTARLVQDASAFCDTKGKEINLISSNSNDVQLGRTPAAEIQFQCLEKGSAPNSELQQSAQRQFSSTIDSSRDARDALSLNDAKSKCLELGFKQGTEEFGKCVLKLSK